MKHHTTDESRRAFAGRPLSWIPSQDGFVLHLPGPMFVCVVPSPTEDGWNVYEVTATGLEIHAENEALDTARCIGEMVAAVASLPRTDPESGPQP